MGKEENKLAKIVNFIIKIFWIFIIGSIFGFFVEMIYSTLYTRMIVIRKGLIYGPFVQVYGMGAVAYYLLITKVKEPRDAFFTGMIMGGILEYICSFFQEILFGSISWDYSKMFMNFNGRICLLYCFYWGIIAVMFLKIIYPCLEKIEPMIYKKSVRIFTVFLMIFMTFDITISCMAAKRQQERHNYIPAKTQVDVFLDRVYPDEYLDKIYNNKIEIKEESK